MNHKHWILGSVVAAAIVVSAIIWNNAARGGDGQSVPPAITSATEHAEDSEDTDSKSKPATSAPATTTSAPTTRAN